MGEYINVQVSAMLAVEDEFHLHAAAGHLQELEYGGLPVQLPDDESVELMQLTALDGAPAYVLRQRHNTVMDRRREDVYFGFRAPDASEAPSSLSILVDDLTSEQQWIEASAFERIKPWHEGLAQKVVGGGEHHDVDVTRGSHEQVREFMRLLHAAVSMQRQARRV